MSGLLDAVGQAFGELVGLPAVGMAFRVIVAGLVILWLATAWWTWRDARSRTRDPFLPYLASAVVLLATPLLFPAAVVVYRVARPARPIAAAEAAELELAILAASADRQACARCGAVVHDDWVACPRCGSSLTVPCAACGRPVELDWSICAWCAAELPWVLVATGPDSPAERGPAEPVAIPIRPGGRPLVPVMLLPDDAGEPSPVGASRRSAAPRRLS